MSERSEETFEILPFPKGALGRVKTLPYCLNIKVLMDSHMIINSLYTERREFYEKSISHHSRADTGVLRRIVLRLCR